MNFLPLSFAATKERGKEKWPFADMNATLSVRPHTAASKRKRYKKEKNMW